MMVRSSYISYLGRLLIGVPFIIGGLSKLAAYGTTTALIAEAGLPVAPIAYAVALAVELGGGLLLVAGYKARLVAIALALFCLATALSFHSNFADEHQMFHFLKNLMIAGGLLQIRYFRCGRNQP